MASRPYSDSEGEGLVELLALLLILWRLIVQCECQDVG